MKKKKLLVSKYAFGTSYTEETMTFIVIGSEFCTYCAQARSLLHSKGVEYKYQDIGNLSQQYLNNLMKIADKPFKSVPQIFCISGEDMEYVGGFTDLQERLS